MQFNEKKSGKLLDDSNLQCYLTYKEATSGATRK